jgi:hypothetical protein
VLEYYCDLRKYRTLMENLEFLRCRTLLCIMSLDYRKYRTLRENLSARSM